MRLKWRIAMALCSTTAVACGTALMVTHLNDHPRSEGMLGYVGFLLFLGGLGGLCAAIDRRTL